MNFIDAVAVVKEFPSCHLKIFRGFFEWGICDIETDGYVILADTALAKGPVFSELESYSKSHDLSIDKGQDYLVIRTVCYAHTHR